MDESPNRIMTQNIKDNHGMAEKKSRQGHGAVQLVSGPQSYRRRVAKQQPSNGNVSFAKKTGAEMLLICAET